MFRAMKQHVTTSYHVKLEHGMNVLKAYNKSPLLTISQKGSQNTLQACEHSKNINRFILGEKLEHGINR